MAETKIYPQSLLLGSASAPSQTVQGMPWYDITNSVLNFDTTGSGDFAPALPQHTADGQHGPKVTIDQTGADNALVVAKSNTSGDDVVQIDNSGTGSAMLISQQSSGAGLRVEPSSITAQGIVVQRTNVSATSQMVELIDAGAGQAFRIEQSGSSSSNAATIVKSNTGTGAALSIDDAGAGNSVFVDQTNPDSDPAVEIQSNASTTNGPALAVQAKGISATGGRGIVVNRTDAATVASTQTLVNFFDTVNQSTGRVAAIQQLSSDASGEALLVANSGSGQGVLVEQDGLGNGVEIQKSNTSGGGVGLVINNQSPSSDAAHIVSSQQSGRALKVELTNMTATGAAIEIVNDGTGNDISADNWHVTNAGDATFNDVDADVLTANELQAGGLVSYHTVFQYTGNNAVSRNLVIPGWNAGLTITHVEFLKIGGPFNPTIVKAVRPPGGSMSNTFGDIDSFTERWIRTDTAGQINFLGKLSWSQPSNVITITGGYLNNDFGLNNSNVTWAASVWGIRQ